MYKIETLNSCTNFNGANATKATCIFFSLDNKKIRIFINNNQLLQKQNALQTANSQFVMRCKNKQARAYKFLIQIFLKLIGALGSPCACNLIGHAPCAL
jgi:hypothetical protein